MCIAAGGVVAATTFHNPSFPPSQNSSPLPFFTDASRLATTGRLILIVKDNLGPEESLFQDYFLLRDRSSYFCYHGAKIWEKRRIDREHAKNVEKQADERGTWREA